MKNKQKKIYQGNTIQTIYNYGDKIINILDRRLRSDDKGP